jgi:ribonuclease BN (tRNA processing enzyme)
MTRPWTAILATSCAAALVLSSLCAAASASSHAALNPAPLELVVLGSGGPGATGRASSSYLVLLDGTPRILVDAGSGSFVTLGKSGLSLEATDLVLLTHLHIDHVGELPGMFKARAVSGGGPITFNVWGPAGSAASSAAANDRAAPTGAYFPSTSAFLGLLFGARGAFAYLRDFAAPITLVPHDLPLSGDDEPRVIFRDPGLEIRAISGHHGDAPAVIYRIDHAGKSVTFSGDIDAHGLAHLTRIARDTDLLVFNAVVLDPPGSPEILYTLHSPPRAIGTVAGEAHVHRLLLSHLSPATDHDRDAVKASIRRAYAGPVDLAEDGLRLRP